MSNPLATDLAEALECLNHISKLVFDQYCYGSPAQTICDTIECAKDRVQQAAAPQPLQRDFPKHKYSIKLYKKDCFKTVSLDKSDPIKTNERILDQEEAKLGARYKEIMKMARGSAPSLDKALKAVHYQNKFLRWARNKAACNLVHLIRRVVAGNAPVYDTPVQNELGVRGRCIMSVVTDLSSVKPEEGKELRKKWGEILDRERFAECWIHELAEVLSYILGTE
jgi:hypothetical protein